MTAIEQNVEPLIAEVAKRFAGDVIRIRYRFGEDWEGDPAIFFNVLLSNDAASDHRFGEVGHAITKALSDPLYSVRSDPFPFVNFRNQSEQDELRDPEWA